MLISVIIPTRDRPDYLAEAVASVLVQTHRQLELLIVNDGSVPVSLPDDNRVRVLDSGQRGAVPARNMGLDTARGDVIAWLDDDDTWIDATFLDTAQSVLASSGGLVFADGTLIYPDGRTSNFAQNANAVSLENNNTILISAVCYRKSLHDELGLFDKALPYYWDWDWYLRVARSGHNLHRIVRPVVNIRIHENNMSGTINVPARTENLNVFATKHGLGKIPLKSHVDFAT